jgi:hypothetical protein
MYYEIQGVDKVVAFDSALMDWNGNLRPVACAITSVWSSPLATLSCANPAAAELTGFGVQATTSDCPK